MPKRYALILLIFVFNTFLNAQNWQTDFEQAKDREHSDMHLQTILLTLLFFTVDWILFEFSSAQNQLS